MDSTHQKPENASGQRPRSTTIFGGFVLDRDGQQLLRDGQPLPLRPKVWQLLCLLSDNTERVLTSDQILDEIWQRASVSPQVVSNAIRELRVTLGDDARNPQWIQTVHGRGYRFVPPKPAQAGRNPILIGRNTSLHRIGEAAGRATGGQRQIVLVTGPAGIGKTFLCRAAVDIVSREHPGAVVAHGQCVQERGAGEPYLPIVDVFGQLFADRADQGTLKRIAPTWALQLPGMLSAGEQEEATRAVAGTTNVRMLREGTTALESLAKNQLVVMLIEDLQWCDGASLEFLTHLAARAAPARVLLLATYRREEAESSDASTRRPLHDLATRDGVTRVDLHPFTTTEVADYLEAYLPGINREPQIASLVHQRALGNPLYVRSLLDQMIDCRAIVASEDGWSFQQTEEDWQRVPDALIESVVARTSRLAEGPRALLEAASVAGASFSTGVIEGMVDADQSVESDLEELCSRGWLHAAAAATYSFAHSLYRDILYQSLSSQRRRALHRAFAAQLEASGSGSPALLAYHYSAAGDDGRALHNHTLAAAAAYQRFAYEEAASSLETALELLEAVEHDERDSLEATLRLQLASTLVLCAGYSRPDIGAHFERSRELAVQLGDLRQEFLSHMGSSIFLITTGQLESAADCTARLREISGSAAPELAAIAACWSSYTASSAGDITTAARFLEEGLRVDQPDPELPLFHDIRRLLRAQQSLVLAELGYLDRSRAVADAVLADSRALGAPPEIAHVSLRASEAAVLRDDPEGGNVAQICVEVCEENGLPSFHAMASIFAAALAPDRGAARVGEMQNQLERRRVLGDRWQESMILGLIASAHLASGNAEAALATVSEALYFTEEHGETHYVPELLRRKAAALRAVGADDAAEPELRRALAAARGQNARLWELRAVVSMGELLTDTGRRHAAIELVAETADRLEPAIGPINVRTARRFCEEA